MSEEKSHDLHHNQSLDKLTEQPLDSTSGEQSPDINRLSKNLKLKFCSVSLPISMSCVSVDGSGRSSMMAEHQLDGIGHHKKAVVMSTSIEPEDKGLLKNSAARTRIHVFSRNVKKDASSAGQGDCKVTNKSNIAQHSASKQPCRTDVQAGVTVKKAESGRKQIGTDSKEAADVQQDSTKTQPDNIPVSSQRSRLRKRMEPADFVKLQSTEQVQMNASQTVDSRIAMEKVKTSGKLKLFDMFGDTGLVPLSPRTRNSKTPARRQSAQLTDSISINKNKSQLLTCAAEVRLKKLIIPPSQSSASKSNSSSSGTSKSVAAKSTCSSSMDVSHAKLSVNTSSIGKKSSTTQHDTETPVGAPRLSRSRSISRNHVPTVLPPHLEWFAVHIRLEGYRNGLRIPDDDENCGGVVKVQVRRSCKQDLPGIGSECMQLWKMSAADVLELKEQVRAETAHRRSEHIMPLVMSLPNVDDQATTVYHHAEQNSEIGNTLRPEREFESVEDVSQEVTKADDKRWNVDIDCRDRFSSSLSANTDWTLKRRNHKAKKKKVPTATLR